MTDVIHEVKTTILLCCYILGKEAEAKQIKAQQLVEQKGKIIERTGKQLDHTIIRTDKSNSAATNAGTMRLFKKIIH